MCTWWRFKLAALLLTITAWRSLPDPSPPAAPPPAVARRATPSAATTPHRARSAFRGAAPRRRSSGNALAPGPRTTPSPGGSPCDGSGLGREERGWGEKMFFYGGRQAACRLPGSPRTHPEPSYAHERAVALRFFSVAQGVHAPIPPGACWGACPRSSSIARLRSAGCGCALV
jgi:hypothetical protein